MAKEVYRVGPIPWLCVVGVVLAAGMGPRAQIRVRGGTVEGHVTVVSRPSRRLSSAGAYPGRTVTVSPSAWGSELSNVVVFVDAPGRAVTDPSRASIRQSNEAFSPRVVAVTAGSTVDFPNDDSIFHNVFSLSSAATFDLGRYARGESKAQRFDKPGVVKVFCHLHSHMTALVRVFDHPYFAIPDASGRFVMQGVPPGSYHVVAWHERVGDVTREATVADGGTTSLTFSLPLTSLQ